MKTKEKAIRITAADFFTWIFATLASRGYEVVPYGLDFEEAVATIFQEMQELADQRGVESRFRVRLHDLHRKSVVIDYELSAAIMRGLIFWITPGSVIGVRLTKERARDILDKLAWKDMFVELADRMVSLPFH